MRLLRGPIAVAALLTACPEPTKPPPAVVLQKPAPLAPLIAERVAIDAGRETEATFTVKPFAYAGDSPPAGAMALRITGERLSLGGSELALPALKERLGPQPIVVVSFDDETYLAQGTGVLAVLDDSHAQVWLHSPDVAALAWPVKLRDEASFNAWLEEPVAGKLRIVHRSDGYELQTNMGKLAGEDPKGPTVPTRGGAFDLVTLQKGLDRVKQRFTDAPDVCFMPSYGLPLNDVTRAVASNWISKEKVVYSVACLVYPRPAPRKP